MSVSRETELRLEAFVDLLERWNTRINLVGHVTRREIWSRHIEDSLRLVALIPPDVSSAIDLGSGAGFPGLVVAIVTGLHFNLVESDRRKAAFLIEAARISAALVTVHTARIESCPCPRAKLITSRAVAQLPRLLTLAHPMLAENGICLFHKGRNVETELAAARKDWTMATEQFRSRSDPTSVILRLSNLTRA